IRKYTQSVGEFVHFDKLLSQDMYASIILDVDDEIKQLFKEEDIVWLRAEGSNKRIRIIEATFNNKEAYDEYLIVKEKLKNMPQDKSTTLDGQSRFSCFSSVTKKDMN